MKKLTNQFISIILILSMLCSLSVTAFATEHNSSAASESISELDDEPVVSIIQETYAALSPEMQTRVLQVIAGNSELRKYYQEEIDPSISWQKYIPSTGHGRLAVAKAAANDPIKNIERRLSKIGIPAPVITEAILFAGGLVLAAADGPLPFGDAVAVYRGTKFAIVLGKHWTVVAPLFGTITLIFREELGNAVSGITKLFNQAKADAKKAAEKNKDSDDRTINPNGLTEKERNGINSALKGSKKGKATSGRTEQREKKGTYEDALKDFEKIPLSDKKDIATRWGKGRTGKLSNGKSVTVRPKSSEGSPTLQIPEGASRQMPGTEGQDTRLSKGVGCLHIALLG